jgi:hypothetical protein
MELLQMLPILSGDVYAVHGLNIPLVEEKRAWKDQEAADVSDKQP